MEQFSEVRATGKEEARTRGRERQDVDTSWESEPRHDIWGRRGEKRRREKEGGKEGETRGEDQSMSPAKNDWRKRGRTQSVRNRSCRISFVHKFRGPRFEHSWEEV